jgi:hypothetical protein
MNDLISLYEFILGLLRDQHAQAEFRRDPRHVLERHDLQHVTADDIRDLMPVVVDHRAVQPISDHAAVSMPSFAPAPGDSDPQGAVVHVIDHFMNSYTYNVNDSCSTANFNDHSTTVYESMHTDLWGGDPSVTLDAATTVASAPGAVASGGAILGTVTTGADDATGSDNHPVITTDSGNTTTTTHLTSFGSGATNTIGDGNTSTAASDSGNTSNSHDASYTGNTTNTNTNTHITNTNTSTATDSNDGNGDHIDHSALGSSYSATDVHDTTDTNDHVLHLDVH